MQAEESIFIARGADEVFAAVARVEDYGSFSPQYRGTRVLEQGNGRLVLERRARVAGLPLRWLSEARVEAPGKVSIRQIEGPLQGMRTDWAVQPQGEGAKVTLAHQFCLRFPFRAMERIIYNLILRKMARTMLSSIKSHLESVEGRR